MTNIWWCEVHLLGGIANTEKADHCPIRWGNYPDPLPCRMVGRRLVSANPNIESTVDRVVRRFGWPQDPYVFAQRLADQVGEPG